VNAIAVDVKAKIARKSDTIEGERVPKEGEEENVEALQAEIEDLQTIERIERGFAAPESAAQIAGWMESGMLGKNGKEKGLEFAKDHDLLPESREQVREMFQAGEISRDEAKLIIEQFDL